MEQFIRFVMVRHGETVANKTSYIQGQSESELTDLGRAQAHATAEALRGEHFDACYSSDLKRALDTAKTILAAGHDGLAAQPEPGLREWKLGVFEGRPVAEFRAAFSSFQRTICDVNGDVQIPGGESRGEFMARVGRTLSRLAARHRAGERILLVTHGGAIRMALGVVYGPPAPNALAPEVANAGVTVMDYYPAEGKWRLVSWNC